MSEEKKVYCEHPDCHRYLNDNSIWPFCHECWKKVLGEPLHTDFTIWTVTKARVVDPNFLRPRSIADE